VQVYVPYFPRKKWPVTIGQLLGHLGGISHYQDYDKEGHIKERKNTRESLDIFKDFDLVAEPGTKYNYTSYGYNLLGAAVEGAANKPFGECLKEYIFEPLGMDESYMDDPSKIIPNRVSGYRLIFGKLINSEFVNISSRFAAGGTRSTVVDLIKYAKGLQGTKILSRKTIDLMETSMVTRERRFTDYGMGWRINPVNGRFVALHTGGQPETRTLLVRFPSVEMAIALAYNLEGGMLYTYVQRLYQIIMDESWNMSAYSGDPKSKAIFSGLFNVFNFGLSYYDRFKKSLDIKSDSLSEAFSYFNASVNRHTLEKNFKKALLKIHKGRHPVARQAFVKVGSFMAEQLVSALGQQKKEIYHKMGAITFFNDYIKLYKSNSSIPKSYRFSSQLESTILNWQKDWEKTWTASTRQLWISSYTNPAKISNRLKNLFSGCTVYPDFTSEFARAIQHLYLKGFMKQAMETAQVVREIYPQSAVPLALLANCYALSGKPEKARQLYLEAKKKEIGAEAVNISTLRYYASQLFRNNKLNQALSLLTLFCELFPKEARLYSIMGDIYLELSRRNFKKATTINPTLEHPWDQLKKIR
jgi:tetratricopeptide (TPR) repeat protein